MRHWPTVRIAVANCASAGALSRSRCLSRPLARSLTHSRSLWLCPLSPLFCFSALHAAAASSPASQEHRAKGHYRPRVPALGSGTDPRGLLVPADGLTLASRKGGECTSLSLSFSPGLSPPPSLPASAQHCALYDHAGGKCTSVSLSPGLSLPASLSPGLSLPASLRLSLYAWAGGEECGSPCSSLPLRSIASSAIGFGPTSRRSRRSRSISLRCPPSPRLRCFSAGGR